MSKKTEPISKMETPTGIPNTEYVTITRDGVFVGGEPATKYHGEDIYNRENLPLHLVQASAAMEYEHGRGIREIHALQSSTKGEYAKPGTPAPDADGTYCWCRVVFDDGTASSWVFAYDSSYAYNCAVDCADFCGGFVQVDADFRAAVFGTTPPTK